jgi:DNA segregation ATPase FtsK/SpoIIIE-like protein
MNNDTPNKKLLIQARKVVTTYNNYSISFLQRKLGVGYNTATILMNILKKDKM